MVFCRYFARHHKLLFRLMDQSRWWPTASLPSKWSYPLSKTRIGKCQSTPQQIIINKKTQTKTKAFRAAKTCSKFASNGKSFQTIQQKISKKKI